MSETINIKLFRRKPELGWKWKVIETIVTENDGVKSSRSRQVSEGSEPLLHLAATKAGREAAFAIPGDVPPNLWDVTKDATQRVDGVKEDTGECVKTNQEGWNAAEREHRDEQAASMERKPITHYVAGKPSPALGDVLDVAVCFPSPESVLPVRMWVKTSNGWEPRAYVSPGHNTETPTEQHVKNVDAGTRIVAEAVSLKQAASMDGQDALLDVLHARAILDIRHLLHANPDGKELTRVIKRLLYIKDLTGSLPAVPGGGAE